MQVRDVVVWDAPGRENLGKENQGKENQGKYMQVHPERWFMPA